MKEKIKRFLLEKKELLIFIGVVVFVFAAVIAVAGIALNNTNPNEIINNNDNQGNDDDQVDSNPSNDDDNDDPVIVISPTFALPISGDYVVVRSFFDISLGDEELASAIISNGTSLETSKGISYAKSDDTEFDVLAINDGEVVDIKSDELSGSTITIKHSEEVTSIYYSLSNVTVTVGSSVKKGDKLATASTSIDDTEASVHVHLEVVVDNAKINPSTIMGKSLDDLTEGK